MEYAKQLKHPKWQKLRLEILKRDKWECKYCGDEETTLHIHHLKYTAKNAWQEPKENLITVCEHCHKIIEYYKANYTILKLKKYTNHYGKVFIVQCTNLKIYVDVLTENEGIIEVTNFNKELIIELGKYFHSA